MDFTTAEQERERLRLQHAAGQITGEAYAAAVNALRVTDAQGTVVAARSVRVKAGLSGTARHGSREHPREPAGSSQERPKPLLSSSPG